MAEHHKLVRSHIAAGKKIHGSIDGVAVPQLHGAQLISGGDRGLYGLRQGDDPIQLRRVQIPGEQGLHIVGGMHRYIVGFGQAHRNLLNDLLVL